MGKPLIMVKSITYAMKGKEILSEAGFKVEIKKVPPKIKYNGCGYGIYVNSRVEEAEKLLIKNNIEIKAKIMLDDDK